MRRLILLLSVIATSVFAQIQPEKPRVQKEVTFAEGETSDLDATAGIPSGGFPNWSERVIFAMINRARSAPQMDLAECRNCPDALCYQPVPPLAWSEQLSRAARFHADEMRMQKFFGHDSKCIVNRNIGSTYPTACDGSAACACSGEGTTSWSSRVRLFGASPTSEVIVTTDDPRMAFYAWLHESTTSSACRFSAANGHRWVILTSEDAVGVGASGYAVGDFGSGGGPPSKIASGAHYPKSEQTIEVWATWYDFAGPRAASIVVDGVCTPLSLRRGTPQNGTYEATLSGLETGCHPYYFVFTDGSGQVFTYPSDGSFNIGTGTCPDWSGGRVASTCDAPRKSRRRLTGR